MGVEIRPDAIRSHRAIWFPAFQLLLTNIRFPTVGCALKKGAHSL